MTDLVTAKLSKKPQGPWCRCVHRNHLEEVFVLERARDGTHCRKCRTIYLEGTAAYFRRLRDGLRDAARRAVSLGGR